MARLGIIDFFLLPPATSRAYREISLSYLRAYPLRT